MTESNSSSTRKEYIKAAQAAFISLAKKKVLAFFVTKFAFLGWGPVGILFGMLVEKIITVAVKDVETAVFFAYVDFRVSGQEKVFTAASLEYYRIQTTGTKEEIDAAEKKLIAAFTDFVKLNHY